MLNMDHQPTSRHPMAMNGRNNRFSDYGTSTPQEPGSQASSFSQNTKNGGDWGIWSGPQMRPSPFSGVQSDRRDDTYLNPMNDGKIGSSALGGESEWPVSQKSWKGSSSPAASNTFLQDRSPIRYRNNDSQSTRDTSPYNPSQQGAIGQSIGLVPPANGSLMEGPGSYNENIDFQDIDRGRPNQRYSMMNQLNMGADSQLNSMLKGLDGDGNRMVKSRVVSNSRNGDIGHNMHADRSESLPPRQRTNSSSPYQHSEVYGQYPMIPQPLSSGYGNPNRNRGRFEDATPAFADNDFGGQVRHMSLEDTPYHRSQLSAQLANSSVQNPYPRVGEYSIGGVESQSYNGQSSGWSREPTSDNMIQFRNNHTVDAPSLEHRVSDNRKSLPAGFHVNALNHMNRNNHARMSMSSNQMNDVKQHGYSGVIPRDMPMHPSYMSPSGQVPYEYNSSVSARNFSYQASPISPVLPSHNAQSRRSVQDDLSLRSAVLEDFRTNSKSKRYDLKDIYNHVVEFSGDQHGSRFIQTKLETANSDEKDLVFAEIRPNCLQLMTDVFGNYVIQKFFEHGSQMHKTILAKHMEGHVVNLSLQMYGCRVVQKALEHVLFDQQASLIKELEGHVLQCVKDQNGNHVIQKAIERIPAEHIQFIIKAFDNQVHALAVHPYGCRVIQRMLEHCDETAQASILAELYACMYPLVQDQYGNYVTQHVIEHGKPQDRAKIIEIVSQHVVHFSKHKFASNVVEKSIQHGSESQRRDILESITKRSLDGTSPLPNLIKDQFGNYVIQKLLTMLQGKDRESLIEQIKPQLQGLKKFAFGKQISAIEKMMFMYAPNTSDPATPPMTSSERTESPSPLFNGTILSTESVSDAPSTTVTDNKQDQVS